MESFSQAGQDKFPQTMLHGVSGPKRYLDIGCHHPTVFNNSYALERAGWNGVSIDIQDFSREFASQRTNTFIQANVLTIDWEPIIVKYFPERVIDYISFDVDDATEIAFQRFPFSTVRFKTITLEHDGYRVGARLRDSIRKTFTDLGYTLVCADVVAEGYGAFEDWWVDKSAVDNNMVEQMTCSNTPSKRIVYPI
jgi:hypothetical protein